MKLGVIGSGAWGTALAVSSARAGSKVVIWSRSRDVADEINKSHTNSKYLGKIKLDKNIKASSKMEDMKDCDALLLAVPAQQLREIVDRVSLIVGHKNGSRSTAHGSLPIIISAKGVEQNSLELMSEVVAEYFPKNPVLIISGPNFADEVAKGLPACATLASTNKKASDKVIKILGNKLFRLYYTNDIIGAQIGGAVKNVIAIAAGIAIGRGLGENARAALVTRGIAELGRLCTKMGGRAETLMGLSGIGDIMLTCASEKSRNMHLGVEIGKKGKFTKAMQGKKTVEGVATSKSVAALAKKLKIDMPITKAVYSILYEGASIEETINFLLERPFVVEKF